MAADDRPRRGDKFEHARLIVRPPNAGPRPDVCEVTSIRNGRVYYCTESGRLFSKPLAAFERSVGRWLTEETPDA
jgi:hypothetical protein